MLWKFPFRSFKDFDKTFQIMYVCTFRWQLYQLTRFPQTWIRHSSEVTNSNEHFEKIAFSNALISIKSMSNFSTSYFNCICSAKNKITRVNFFTISLDIAILLISNNFLPSRRGRSPPLYIKTTSKAFVSKKARCIVKVQFCTSTVPSSNSKQFMLRLMKAFCLQLDQIGQQSHYWSF